MKKIFILLALLVSCILSLISVFVHAQNYKISFAGAGASYTVDSVQVENLTQCKSTSIKGTDTLNLSVTNGINELQPGTVQSAQCTVFPNPMTGYSFIAFDALTQGESTISLYDIAGKRITQLQEFLSAGKHTYSLSGLGSGVYVLKVESAQYEYSAKIVSANLSLGNALIKHITSASSDNTLESINLKSKSLKSNQGMQYNAGDTLKLTGFSGYYSTAFILVPTKSQIITFTFVNCTDGDYNYYTVVQIGTQLWMEQNLMTTTYSDGKGIPLVTDNTAWAGLTTGAYCWYNDSLKYENIYGALYNWYAASDTNKICPAAWHLPSNAEWDTLISFLGGANSLAGDKLKENCTKHWFLNSGATNSSGFTALPGGLRAASGGAFNSKGDYGYFWSFTPVGSYGAWYCFLAYNYAGAQVLTSNNPYGFSVRCIKDCPKINAPGFGTNIVLPNQITWKWLSVSGATGYKWNTTNNYSTATDNGMSTSYIQQCLKANSPDTLYVWAYNTCTYSAVTEIIQSTNAFLNCGTVTDYDGNVYNTVSIGNQCWMQQNLKTTAYNDGTPIPYVTGDTAWYNLVADGYCWYGDSVYYKKIYGALYNWSAAWSGKLCPTGWHVPSDSEWIKLATYLGGDSVAGGKLKETCTTHWFSPNTGATNSSGFTALPAGDRDGINGLFLNKGNDASFWTYTGFDFTDSWAVGLDYSNKVTDIYTEGNTYGFSVRCVKSIP